MIGQEDSYLINGVQVKPASGTCSSYNIIYMFICKLCNTRIKCYVGRSTRPLHERTAEHRKNFYKVLRDPSIKFSDEYLANDCDTYSLASHLIDGHYIERREDFDLSYTVIILMNSSPSNLEMNEHLFVQKLRTIKPLGINACDPLGMPLLFKK